MTFLFTNETFLYQILMTRPFVQNIYHSLVRQEGESPKLEATKGFIGWIHIHCMCIASADTKWSISYQYSGNSEF